MLSKREDLFIGYFVFSLMFIGIFFDVGPVCMVGWNPMLGECSNIVR